MRAIDNMNAANPPRVFAEQFYLLNERIVGGQALVNFARDRDGGFFQYAVKCAGLCPIV